MAAAKPEDKDPVESIARNKRARHDYELIESWEAGLVLTGTEVKALRAGQASMNDAFGIVRVGEVFVSTCTFRRIRTGVVTITIQRGRGNSCSIAARFAG